MNNLFHIFKVDAQKAQRIAQLPNAPHNHDFEELLIGIEGQLEHFIDFENVTINAPFVSFVTKNKTHRVLPKAVDGKCSIWGIRFKSEFIPETAFQLYALYHNHANLEVANAHTFKRLITLITMMYEEYQHKHIDYALIRQLLSVLLTMIERERKQSEPETASQKNQQIAFGNFLQILEKHYKQPHGVEFYAEKLFMTSRNLNLICHAILEQSVSEIIETRKLTEAKNLLITTDQTISEIAYQLGYKEGSYFSKVFKKKSGQSPGEFREEMRNTLIS